MLRANESTLRLRLATTFPRAPSHTEKPFENSTQPILSWYIICKTYDSNRKCLECFKEEASRKTCLHPETALAKNQEDMSRITNRLR